MEGVAYFALGRDDACLVSLASLIGVVQRSYSKFLRSRGFDFVATKIKPSQSSLSLKKSKNNSAMCYTGSLFSKLSQILLMG